MTEQVWTCKRKGSGRIYTHPALKRAIVDTCGFGARPGIYYDGISFKKVAHAMEYAEGQLIAGSTGTS